MTLSSTHPRDQIAAIMTRIYRNGLTTLSGGNLSIRDDDGGLWITPAGLGVTPTGIDKGRLRPEDVVRMRADGSVKGAQRPSSEVPFHRAITDRRPDVRAVVHAHPAALVSFSLVHRVPVVRITPQVFQVSGPVGLAAYALPGSAELGEKIAAQFGEGFNNVILENHGVVCGGPDLLTAFQRLEALEYAARIEIKARGLGEVKTLSDAQLACLETGEPLAEVRPDAPDEAESALRRQMVEIMQRGCARQLFTSSQGVISARLGGDRFLITPSGRDREDLGEEDIVRIDSGRREAGKSPSRAARLHRAVYAVNPDVNSVVSGQPVHATAYAVSTARFDTRTIPESYTLLAEVPLLPFEMPYREPEAAARCLSIRQPVVMVENDGVIAVGRSILQAFDRLEVAETSARALIETAALGEPKPIQPSDLEQLTTRFVPHL